MYIFARFFVTLNFISCWKAVLIIFSFLQPWHHHHMLRQPKVTFIPNNIRSLGIVQIRVRRYKSCSLTILLGECSNVGIVNGTIKEDDSLATQAHLYAICGIQCAAYLKMAMWEICGLADGRIVGPGYGGAIESSNADGVVGCWVVCKGNIINSY